MTLRPIARNDLSGLADLCRDHAAHEGLPFAMTGQAARWEALYFGPDPRLFGWVVELDGALAGYMSATVDFATWSAAPFVYLDCLYLAPDARRQGYGRAMMAELEQFARSKGCDNIQWQTPPDNALGLSFYRTLDAHELSKSRFTLRVSDV